MKKFDSPVQLFQALCDLFPVFADEFDEDEEISTYHQVVSSLAPVITSFLENSSERTVKKFYRIVNDSVAEGGLVENAMSTCLLEHASQLKCKHLIRAYLSAAAKNELC